MKITVIGCGRWGTFIAWYLDKIGYTMTVFYDAISESITGYGLDPSNPDVYHSETFLSGESTYQEAYVYDG